MPTKKGLRPGQRKTEATKEVRPRLSIIEEVLMLTAPKWDAKKKAFVKAMPIIEACEIVGISPMTFRNWRQEDKKIHNYYEAVIKSRKEMAHSMMKDYAIGNVMNVLSGSIKLRPKEVVDVSLRYLEKTDGDFNQAIKVETEDKTNPLLAMSRDELTQRIMELSAGLNINVKVQNDNNTEGTTEYANTPDADYIEEPVGDKTSGGEAQDGDNGVTSEGEQS